MNKNLLIHYILTFMGKEEKLTDSALRGLSDEHLMAIAERIYSEVKLKESATPKQCFACNDHVEAINDKGTCCYCEENDPLKEIR